MIEKQSNYYGLLILLITTVSISYVLGNKHREQNTAKPAQTTKNKDNTTV